MVLARLSSRKSIACMCQLVGKPGLAGHNVENDRRWGSGGGKCVRRDDFLRLARLFSRKPDVRRTNRPAPPPWYGHAQTTHTRPCVHRMENDQGGGGVCLLMTLYLDPSQHYLGNPMHAGWTDHLPPAPPGRNVENHQGEGGYVPPDALLRLARLFSKKTDDSRKLQAAVSCLRKARKEDIQY